MINIFRSFFVFILQLSAADVLAGSGYYFYVTNKMMPSSKYPGYPQVTVHYAGGMNCWYLNYLASWDTIASPGAVDVGLYTERDNSGTCNTLFTVSANTNLGIFIKEKPDSSWVRIGKPSTLWNMANVDNASYINPPLPYYPVGGKLGLCGLKVNTFGYVVDSSLPGTNKAYVQVSGTPELDGCDDAYPSNVTGLKETVETNTESFVNERTINMKVGQKKKIYLSGLDADSVWELDGGRCLGDDNTNSDLNRDYTKYRVLPQTINVTATSKGQRTCDLTAYHYPERTFVSHRRYIFVVR